MSWNLKRSLWTATLERYPSSFKEDRERSSSVSRRPTRPFLRRPSTNGVTLQTCSGATLTNLAICAIPEIPRVTRARSRSSDALIPWKQPRRHSFSGSQAPGTHTRNHALPLFTAPRGHQRGVGISTSLIPIDIPDLSLRNTFPPPLLLKDQPKASTCAICQNTYADLERGRRVDSVADTRDYPQCDEPSQLSCDSDNSAKRGRVSIKSEGRVDICSNCRRQQQQQQEIVELETQCRDEEQAKQQSPAEFKEEVVPKAYDESLHEKSREEHEMLRPEREQADIEYMLRKSREEASATGVESEQEDLASALEVSCVLGPANQDATIDKKIIQGQHEVEGDARYCSRTDSTTIIEDHHVSTPPPLPLNPTAVPEQLPSPPATPVRSTPPPRSRPAEKPATPVDFSLPAGQQEYGAYTIGGRRAPVHESQKQQAARYLRSPVTPISPAPVARLGTTIQPSSPSPRPAQCIASPVPVGDLRSSLRRTGGPRRSIPSRTDSEDGSELRARLARRRTLDLREDFISSVSSTRSECASNTPSRASSPVGSDLSRASTVREDAEADQTMKPDLSERRRNGANMN